MRFNNSLILKLAVTVLFLHNLLKVSYMIIWWRGNIWCPQIIFSFVHVNSNINSIICSPCGCVGG